MRTFRYRSSASAPASLTCSCSRSRASLAADDARPPAAAVGLAVRCDGCELDDKTRSGWCGALVCLVDMVAWLALLIFHCLLLPCSPTYLRFSQQALGRVLCRYWSCTHARVPSCFPIFFQNMCQFQKNNINYYYPLKLDFEFSPNGILMKHSANHIVSILNYLLRSCLQLSI